MPAQPVASLAPLTGASLPSTARRRADLVRVLVLGPVSDTGGLARVARMTVDGFDRKRFHVAACDTAKDTPEDRGLRAACVSHWRRWRRLVRALRAHRPGVVHIHTCSYGTFHRSLLDMATCRVFRRPYILHVHGGLFAEFLGSLRGWRRVLVFGGLRRAARVIVLGQCWRTNLTRLVAGLKLAVVPNAIEPGEAVEEGAPRGGGVLFVGDLSETKRPEDLLVAYAALPSAMRRAFPLTIVGGGDSQRRRTLIELAERLSVTGQTRFLGALTHDAIETLMRHADLLVLPSRAEGMPLALLEAMRAALPAVTTRVGAIPEMVTDGTDAVLVEAGDTLELTRAIRGLLADEPRRRQTGMAARARLESRFSVEVFRKSIGDLWVETARNLHDNVPPPVPRLAGRTPL
jgi:glycosyltransferase involved in cell wall biosynthesis